MLVMAFVASQLATTLITNGVTTPIAIVAVLAWSLMAPMVEIMASATNIQWFAAISILVLLIQNTKSWGRRASTLMTLWVAICGISGVPVIIIAPLMMLKAFIKKSKVDAIFSVALIIGGLINALVVFSNSGLENRALVFDIKLILLPTIYQVFYSSFLGVDWAANWSRLHNFSAIDVLLNTGLFISVLIWLIRGSTNKISSLLLALAIIYISAIQTFFAIGGEKEHLALLTPAYGGRYFASGCTAFICMIALLRDKKVALIFLSIIIIHSLPFMYQESLNQSRFPSWSQDIKKCSGNCTIHIWPPNWTIQITK
jgi:hypothetical protein